MGKKILGLAYGGERLEQFLYRNVLIAVTVGRSKPATSSYAQALATHCVGFLLYPSSAELPYAK